MEYAVPALIEHTCGYKDYFWVEAAAHTDCWHLILLEEGRYDCEILGKKEEAGPYSAVFFPPNVQFNRHVIERLKIHHVRFEFDKEDMWLRENGQFLYGKLKVSEEIVKEACDFYNRFLEEEYLPLKDNVIKNLWSHALAAVLCENKGQNRVITDASIAWAVEWMEEHLDEKISIEKLAERLGYTHIRFTRLFSRETGQPPIRYLNERRLQKAKRLLEENELPISDIAAMCGFENQFYLHNRFKRKYGCAPSLYRKHFRI